MPERSGFTYKLLEHVDRLDREAIRNYLKKLCDETALYREAFQELEEGLALIDEKGQVLFLNRSASFWLGVQEDFPLNTKFQDSIEDPVLSRFIKQNLKGLSAKVVQDFQVLSPRESFLRVTLAPYASNGQKIIVVIIANITEQKIRQSDEERLARIEAMVRLTAGLAHEIGNPLNSLNIHLELLKKEVATLPEVKREAVAKTLHILNTETARLDRIVRHFLKATRKPLLRFRLEDLNSLVEEAAQFMAPELSERKIAIKFRPDRSLAPFLMDRERLYQAFINLLKNAMEAMQRGGMIKIRISHRNQVAILHFQDEGQGISERDLPHIFEAYYTTKEEGSGLGLMTVYNHVMEHGGKIEVTSKLGKGTTFAILLPIRRTKLQLTNELKAS
ncbi:MAG: PAS domain S-box protein [Candidatus Omnitrophica bacterium]|nr:PAS domain S-box protein [Candidatus Omnitrophota bacterium]